MKRIKLISIEIFCPACRSLKLKEIELKELEKFDYLGFECTLCKTQFFLKDFNLKINNFR